MAVHDIRGTSLRSARLHEGTALADIDLPQSSGKIN